MEFKEGDQVAYVPTHAQGDLRHPDVEFGFVMEDRGEHCFCRYFKRGGTPGKPPLRTVANSESTPKSMLRRHYHSFPAYVEQLVREIDNGG